MNVQPLFATWSKILLLAVTLVPQIASAGEVMVSFSTGVLTLTGSPTEDVITVSGNPVRCVVRAGLRTTLVPNTSFTSRKTQVFQNVASVVFVGNGGTDDVQVRAGIPAISLTGGPEADNFSVLVPSAATIDLTLDGGDDRVVLQAAMAGNVTVDLGEGANGMSITDSALTGLDITGGTGPDNIVALRLNSAPLLGMALSIVTGDGDDIVGFQECLIESNDLMIPGTLDGGDGVMDSVGQDMSTFTPLPVPVNFEVVIGFDPPPPPPAIINLGRNRR
jgi:hypothetical protein